MPKEIAIKNNNGFTPTPKNFGVGARYKCLPVQILTGKICSGTACLPAEALAKAGGLCLPRSQLCCTTGVRIGGTEKDYKVIHK